MGKRADVAELDGSTSTAARGYRESSTAYVFQGVRRLTP
jgi:hypothetical protein